MNEWIKGTIEFAAAGGTLWAALSARKSAEISSKQLDTQLQQQKNAERPRLVPLNTEIDIGYRGVYTDWFSSTREGSNYLSNKSFFNIKMINTGKTFALDIVITFKFKGGTQIFDYHYNDNLSLLLLDQSKADSPDIDDFYIYVEEDSRWNKLNKYGDKDEHVHIAPTNRHVPLVQHAESLEVEIPKYFIILSNAYAMVHESDTPFEKPSLIMNLSYKDEYMKTYNEIFIVELSDVTTPREGGLRINGRLTFVKEKPTLKG